MSYTFVKKYCHYYPVFIPKTVLFQIFAKFFITRDSCIWQVLLRAHISYGNSVCPSGVS